VYPLRFTPSFGNDCFVLTSYSNGSLLRPGRKPKRMSGGPISTQKRKRVSLSSADEAAQPEAEAEVETVADAEIEAEAGAEPEPKNESKPKAKLGKSNSGNRIVSHQK